MPNWWQSWLYTHCSQAWWTTLYNVLLCSCQEWLKAANISVYGTGCSCKVCWPLFTIETTPHWQCSVWASNTHLLSIIACVVQTGQHCLAVIVALLESKQFLAIACKILEIQQGPTVTNALKSDIQYHQLLHVMQLISASNPDKINNFIEISSTQWDCWKCIHAMSVSIDRHDSSPAW